MKLRINFDLMEQVVMANKGFSLSKEFKSGVLIFTTYLGISLIINFVKPINIFLNSIECFVFRAIIYIPSMILLKEQFKKEFINKLRELSAILKTIK